MGIDFSRAVVVLTGAAGGIGRPLARRLVARGASVALVDRDELGLQKLAEELGARASAHAYDLRDRDGFDALLASVSAQHGPPNVLINNAGLTVHGPFGEQSREEVERVFDVDLRAAVELTRVMLPHLRAARGGHVVLVSSMAGVLAFPMQSTYSAAKFGLRGFGAALRIELAAEGVGVSTIVPGTIATSFLRNASSHDASDSERLARLMERFGTSPDRVAKAIVGAIEHNRGVVRVGWDSHLVELMNRWAPSVAPTLLRLAYRYTKYGPNGRGASR